MKLAWITDPHFNFLERGAFDAFCKSVVAWDPAAIIVSGDIAEADTIEDVLGRLEASWLRPIYFVLGNHDFYRGGFDDVRARVRALCAKSTHLTWLDTVDTAISLSQRTGLLGHGGWADARLGDFARSSVVLNDYLVIRDLMGLDRERCAAKLRALGDEAAAHVRRVLPPALDRFAHVLFVMHVPPFREACWHDNRASDDDWLPHFSCKAVGDALVEIMATRPERTLSVVCGHTHSAGEYWPLPNVCVRTGDAEYGAPRFQPPICVP